MSPKILPCFLWFCHVINDSAMSPMILSCQWWSCHITNDPPHVTSYGPVVSPKSIECWSMGCQLWFMSYCPRFLSCCPWFMSCCPWFMSYCPWFMSCRNWSRCQCFVPIFLYFPNISSLLWLALFSVCEYFAMKNKFPLLLTQYFLSNATVCKHSSHHFPATVCTE